MFDRLEVFEKKYEECNQKLYDPAIVSDPEAYAALMKEVKGLEPVVEKYKEYKKQKNNEEEAKQLLAEAGYDVNEVQSEVNAILRKSKLKSNDEIAREVIRGKWGEGANRRTRLTNAGYDYITVQKIVNRVLSQR